MPKLDHISFWYDFAYCHGIVCQTFNIEAFATKLRLRNAGHMVEPILPFGDIDEQRQIKGGGNLKQGLQAELPIVGILQTRDNALRLVHAPAKLRLRPATIRLLAQGSDEQSDPVADLVRDVFVPQRLVGKLPNE